MIYESLKASGKQAVLGGNVRGVSNLALLNEVMPEHVAVLELDSWQLQGWGEASISPHLAVFTTFYPDHLNYYKDDPGQYLLDKANIFLHQDPDDTLVVGSQCAPTLIEAFGEHILAKIVIVGAEHNRYNAALALAVARALEIPDDVSRNALADFKGVPGRLEFLREVRGVKIYNDTTSTTPEATLAALRALGTDAKNIILIMGGADKSLDMNALLLEIPEYTKRVILLPGTGTNRVLEFLPDASVFDDLTKAVQEALIAASPGDVVLFSPAFASFGMFKNEYDRGDQFNAIVAKL
jgi:UDP-N-acetylmuramoylalanine--D-glutamate ligase